MELKKYIKDLNIKIQKLDKKAKNPFLEYDYTYNPFKSAIKQTYIWIEKENQEIN